MHVPALSSNLAAMLHRMDVVMARFPWTQMIVFSELAQCGPVPNAPVSLPGPEEVTLQAAAARYGIWLIPGSVFERGADGKLYNTASVIDPAGTVVKRYRKMFPFRPLEEGVQAGDQFFSWDIEGVGKFGILNCYDIWFPAHTRHLAWGGAEPVLHLFQTAPSDREQELAIVRGNAIMNQVWIASLNAAAPTGRGRSLVVDPDGAVHASSPDASSEVLTAVVDLGQVAEVREFGTAGVSRPRAQFREGDPAIPLPLYSGSITPSTWEPGSPGVSAPESTETRA